MLTALCINHLLCHQELADYRMCRPVRRRRLARFVASKEKAESPFAGGNNLAAAPAAAAEEGCCSALPPSLSDEWFPFLPLSHLFSTHSTESRPAQCQNDSRPLIKIGMGATGHLARCHRYRICVHGSYTRISLKILSGGFRLWHADIGRRKKRGHCE